MLKAIETWFVTTLGNDVVSHAEYKNYLRDIGDFGSCFITEDKNNILQLFLRSPKFPEKNLFLFFKFRPRFIKWKKVDFNFMETSGILERDDFLLWLCEEKRHVRRTYGINMTDAIEVAYNFYHGNFYISDR